MKPLLLALALAFSLPAMLWADGMPDPSPDDRPAAAEALNVDAEEASAYETTVTGRRPISEDETADAVQVAGERLRDSPKPSTLDALSSEDAGIYVSSRGGLHGVANGATGGIHIRGLGGSPNSQVLVVEDGVPDYQGIFGHPIPDAYVPFLIDDVLVIKGGDSVLYGTNALSGVVVIRNRWRDTEGYEVMNDAAYGSFATLRESLSALARRGRLDAAASFVGLSTEGDRAGAGGHEIIGQTAVRYRLGRGWEIEARNKVIRLEGADPGPVTHPNPDHWYDVMRDNASVGLRWKRDAVRLSLTPHLNMGVHRLYDGFYSQDYVAGADAEMAIRLHPMLDVLLGLNGTHVDGRVENRISGESPDVQGLTDIAFYNQFTFHYDRHLTAVLGSRVLYSLTYGMVALYKAGLKWQLFDGLYAHTRIARNYRQPTIRELYLPFPTANPTLRPEQAVNWDIGVGYESDHFEATVTGYRTRAEQMIRYFGAWPTAEVVNADNIVMWGVEGRAGIRRIGPFHASVSADWRDVGRYTRQNPSTKLDGTGGLDRAFGRHFLGGEVTAEWVHGLYMGDYGRDPIGEVVTLDLAIRYRYTVPVRRITIEPYLFLRNLLDRRNAFVEGYPPPGLNVMVGLKLGV